jgi:hypothetical protein
MLLLIVFLALHCELNSLFVQLLQQIVALQSVLAPHLRIALPQASALHEVSLCLE